jgi:hypothetical protein
MCVSSSRLLCTFDKARRFLVTHREKKLIGNRWHLSFKRKPKTNLRFGTGTIWATTTPFRAITTSSPRSAATASCDSFVFASGMLNAVEELVHHRRYLRLIQRFDSLCEYGLAVVASIAEFQKDLL